MRNLNLIAALCGLLILAPVPVSLAGDGPPDMAGAARSAGAEAAVRVFEQPPPAEPAPQERGPRMVSLKTLLIAGVALAAGFALGALVTGGDDYHDDYEGCSSPPSIWFGSGNTTANETGNDPTKSPNAAGTDAGVRNPAVRRLWWNSRGSRGAIPGGWTAALCVALRSEYSRYASFALLASLGPHAPDSLRRSRRRLVDTRRSAHGFPPQPPGEARGLKAAASGQVEQPRAATGHTASTRPPRTAYIRS